MAHCSYPSAGSETRAHLTICIVGAFLMLCSARAHAYCAYVANAHSGTVSVIDTAFNRVVASIDVGKYPEGIAIAADGRSAYVANNHADPGGNTITIVDTRTSTVTGTLTVCTAEAPPLWVAAAPNGSLLATCPGNHTCADCGNVWLAGTELPMGGGRFPLFVAVAPDGGSAYVSNSGTGTVSVIDIETRTVFTSPVPVGSVPAGIAISPDSRYVYVANSEDWSTTAPGTVSVIDTTKALLDPSHAVTATIAVGNNPFDIAISPDGRAAYVTNMQDPSGALAGTVSVIDTTKVLLDPSHAVTTTIAVGNSPLGVATTPDGLFAYVTNSQGRYTSTPGDVSVIDTRSVLADPSHAVIATIAVGNNPSGVAVGSVPEVCPESQAPCVGDCDGGDSVTVNEIITLVNIVLGNAEPAACPYGIPGGAEVNVALIIQAVNHALNGCGGG